MIERSHHGHDKHKFDLIFSNQAAGRRMRLEEGFDVDSAHNIYVSPQGTVSSFEYRETPPSMRSRHAALIGHLRGSGYSALAEFIEKETKSWVLATKRINQGRQASAWGIFDLGIFKSKHSFSQTVEVDYVPLLWSKGECFLTNGPCLTKLLAEGLTYPESIPRFLTSSTESGLVLLFAMESNKLVFQMAKKTVFGQPSFFLGKNVIPQLLRLNQSDKKAQRVFEMAADFLDDFDFNIAMGLHTRRNAPWITVVPKGKKKGAYAWHIVLRAIPGGTYDATNNESLTIAGKHLVVDGVTVGPTGLTINPNLVEDMFDDSNAESNTAVEPANQPSAKQEKSADGAQGELAEEMATPAVTPNGPAQLTAVLDR